MNSFESLIELNAYACITIYYRKRKENKSIKIRFVFSQKFHVKL